MTINDIGEFINNSAREITQEEFLLAVGFELCSL